MAITKVTKSIETDIWYTSDGMWHRFEHEAERHEQRLIDAQIEKDIHFHSIELELPFFDNLLSGEWYFVRNEKELDYFLRRYANHAQWTYVNGHMEGKSLVNIGDWIAPAYVYLNGEREQEGIYTLSHVIKEMKKFIDVVESFTIEGKF